MAKRKIVRCLFNLAAAASLGCAVLLIGLLALALMRPGGPGFKVSNVGVIAGGSRLIVYWGDEPFLNGMTSLLATDRPRSEWDKGTWRVGINGHFYVICSRYALGALTDGMTVDLNIVCYWLGQFRYLGRPVGSTATLGLHPIRALIIASVLPLIWLADQLIRRHRRRCPAGNCQKCGYDLRGSPGDCPECGAPRPPGKVDRSAT
ncbi:MAG: hypothetical protein NTW19_04465 [Planctomycetota bacterium]|nr:hypothetical protein [Planctomycetota bacterium]